MSEIWKDVKGYEGFYQVSDLGNVKSLERTVGGRWGSQNIKEKILKLRKNNSGYYHVDLNRKTKTKIRNIHQLVAMAFLNHKPCGYKLVVNHINLNKLDNRVENLEIVTQRENANKNHLKSSSKYTGVSWYKPTSKWTAQILINKTKTYLGYFKDEYDAHLAYQEALKNIKL